MGHIPQSSLQWKQLNSSARLILESILYLRVPHLLVGWGERVFFLTVKKTSNKPLHKWTSQTVDLVVWMWIFVVHLAFRNNWAPNKAVHICCDHPNATLAPSKFNRTAASKWSCRDWIHTLQLEVERHICCSGSADITHESIQRFAFHFASLREAES